MSDKEQKRGMFSRLFGGKAETPAPAPKAAEEPAIAATADAAPAEAVAPVETVEAAEMIEAVAAPVAEPDVPPVAAEVPVAAAETAEPAGAAEPKKSWFERLKSGLARSSSALGRSITDIVGKRKLDDDTLQDLEDVLIRADLGVETAMAVTEAVAAGRYDKEVSGEEVRAILAREVEKVLRPVARPLVVEGTAKPHVILVVGVNGSGKTTTIGKLASKFRAEGRSVMLAAGDTFRAAAIEQLKIWAGRVGAPIIARETGADAAGLAYDAMVEAATAGVDVLMIDTAGRLQNKAELMAELEKVVRVIRKHDASAPHSVLLVLDATTGQNALNQVEVFGKTAGVTGLVMTKLDGTARGGILVGISKKFGLPVHFIGVGEGIDDLEPFDAADFAEAIAGLGA
ncbi:MAG: signal recognition particle-docking protein FtsY [Hyphomicrobiales bacterium]